MERTQFVLMVSDSLKFPAGVPFRQYRNVLFTVGNKIAWILQIGTTFYSIRFAVPNEQSWHSAPIVYNMKKKKKTLPPLLV